MSVIAKLVIRNVHDFGAGRLVEMSCLCDNDLMKAYAPDHGDKLFTQYSPWGELKLHSPCGFLLGQQDEAFYVVITSTEESGNLLFKGALAYSNLRINSITDFGDGMAKRLDMTNNDWAKDQPNKGIQSFNWKMSVDNPSVFEQLKAGSRDYWIAFYPASLGRDGAINKAHE